MRKKLLTCLFFCVVITQYHKCDAGNFDNYLFTYRNFFSNYKVFGPELAVYNPLSDSTNKSEISLSANEVSEETIIIYQSDFLQVDGQNKILPYKNVLVICDVRNESPCWYDNFVGESASNLSVLPVNERGLHIGIYSINGQYQYWIPEILLVSGTLSVDLDDVLSKIDDYYSYEYYADNSRNIDSILIKIMLSMAFLILLLSFNKFIFRRKETIKFKSYLYGFYFYLGLAVLFFIARIIYNFFEADANALFFKIFGAIHNNYHIVYLTCVFCLSGGLIVALFMQDNLLSQFLAVVNRGSPNIGDDKARKRSTLEKVFIHLLTSVFITLPFIALRFLNILIPDILIYNIYIILVGFAFYFLYKVHRNISRAYFYTIIISYTIVLFFPFGAIKNHHINRRDFKDKFEVLLPYKFHVTSNDKFTNFKINSNQMIFINNLLAYAPSFNKIINQDISKFTNYANIVILNKSDIEIVELLARYPAIRPYLRSSTLSKYFSINEKVVNDPTIYLKYLCLNTSSYESLEVQNYSYIGNKSIGKINIPPCYNQDLNEELSIHSPLYGESLTKFDAYKLVYTKQILITDIKIIDNQGNSVDIDFFVDPKGKRLLFSQITSPSLPVYCFTTNLSEDVTISTESRSSNLFELDNILNAQLNKLSKNISMIEVWNETQLPTFFNNAALKRPSP